MKIKLTLKEPGERRVRCGCGSNQGTLETHSCPYQIEIADNDDPDYCNCCPDCENQCAMDV